MSRIDGRFDHCIMHVSWWLDYYGRVVMIHFTMRYVVCVPKSSTIVFGMRCRSRCPTASLDELPPLLLTTNQRHRTDHARNFQPAVM